jgi:hypothetical protein
MRFLVLEATPVSVKLIDSQVPCRFSIFGGKNLLVLPHWCDQIDDEEIV